jgi:outer membrane receptor protein involved in Fe transport
MAIPTLSASVDYFHIRLKGEIGIVPESVTLSQCLTTGDPTVCSQIVRDAAGTLGGTTPASGGYILGNAVNVGTALVSGIDVQGSVRRALGARWGALAASLSGSWLQHNASTPYRSAPNFDCAGLFGNTCLNGSVNPRWRHNLRVTWETPWNAQLSAQWRFIGHTGFDNNSPQALLQNAEEGFFDPLLTHIPSYSYLDLSGIWAVSRNVQVRVVVNNVLDKDPPFVPQEVSGAAGGLNTFPVYDVLGRDISVALRAVF